jgi:carboxylesterase type B
VLVGEPSTLPQAEKRGQAIAARWKVPPDASLEMLRAVSTADIVAAEPNYLAGDSIPDNFPNLGITVDGYVFPRKPAQVFAAGGQHRVPMLLGNNGREQVPGSTIAKDLPQAIERTYGPLAPRALTLYVGAPDPVYGTTAEQWGTDTSFRCSTVAQAMWHAAAAIRPLNMSSYMCRRSGATRRRARVGTVARVRHIRTRPRWCRPAGAGDRGRCAPLRRDAALLDEFRQDRRSQCPGLPMWPKFDPKSRGYVEFTSSGAAARQGLRRPYCDLFMENVQRVIGK